MINKLYTIFFIQLLFVIKQYAHCQPSSSQQINFVYSPLYYQRYDITDPQGASTKIKVAEKANLVFISAGFEGVIIIDALTNQIIYQQHSDEFLFTIETTSDGQYVMFSYKTKFSLFKFVNRSSLILLSQATFPTSIIDMFINYQETTVYAVGLDGQLVAYDITNKNSIQSIGFYNSQSSIIHQGSISKDGNWILLGNDALGMYVLQVLVDPTNNSQSFVLAGQGIMVWKTWAAVMTDDNKYVYGLDNWNGIFICDFNQILSAQFVQYPITINYVKYWPFNSINPSVYSIKLTKDNNFILVGVRSQGIYIFDIRNRMNPVFYQGIQVGAHAFSVNLSSNEQYLYFANAVSIYIFQKTSPNLNNDYPNLFNTHQISLQNTSTAYYKWRCFTRAIADKQYFFGSFDANGFGIFDSTDPYNMQQVYVNKYKSTSLVDSMAITADNSFLYVPIQENNTSFLVLNLQNISNPFISSFLNMTNPNHNEAVFFSKDQKYLVSSYEDGILLMDSSNPPHLSLLYYWQILPYMTGENAGVMITNDNKYVIGAIRGYGIYILDATNKTNLILKGSLQTLGAEGIIPSYYNDNHAFLFDGFKGIAILDLSVLPQLKILSRVSLQGWTNYVIPISNDQFLLVAQLEAGMISLIDLRDIVNPKVLSSYQYQTQTAQSICMSPDNRYTFINNNLGTIVLPMTSQVSIHTEIQLIETLADGEQALTILQKNKNFFVGQQIQLNFVPLYPQEGMSILSISYYEEQQIQQLPFWINYNSSKRNLLLQVDKSGLNANNITTPNINTVLLQIGVPLKPSNFIYNQTDVVTNSTQAQTLFNYIQQMQYIDSNGLITSVFDPYVEMQFTLQGINCTQRLLSVVRQTLQQSSFVNPVIFYVQPSLSINISNIIAPISTLANTLDFYLQVDSSQGRFVMSTFTGVISSTTDSQNQLKFEGSLTNINRVLSQQIIFANSTSMEGMTVIVTLIDGVNYQVNQVSLITDCVFIKIKQQIHKNPNLSLQTQFDASFPKGVVDVQSEFQIEFSSSTFIVTDIQTITYRVYILKSDVYEELSPDYWIQTQMSSNSISFHGTPPISVFQDTFTIKVVASDGYTQAFDTFTINASGLPFLYILNIFIKIFGPLFALFGIYKYKSLILNSVYRDTVMYSTEIANRGQLYKRKITILGDEMEKSKLLYQNFLSRFINDHAQFREEPQSVKNQLQCYGSDAIIDEEKLNQLRGDNTTTQQKHDSEKQNTDTLSIMERQNEDFTSPRRLKVIRESMSVDNIKLFNSIQTIFVSPKHTRQTALEAEYLKKDGSVSLSRVLRDMIFKNISFTLTRRKYSAKNFLTDFKNPDSRIYKGLKALFSRYFLKLDVRSNEVYRYLKHYSLTQLNYTKNDWYKGLVHIHATDLLDCYGYPIPFPELQLNEDLINLILIDLQVHNHIGQKFETLAEFGINHNLIRDVLFADVWGLVEETPSILSPCVGESIHLFSYEIESVEAYKKVTNTWCLGLRKLFNFHYINYGMSKNMTLPNWIEFDQKNGVITLQGIPQSQDVEEILIKITDIDQYVIKQFHFKIVDEYHGDECNEIQIYDTNADDQSYQVFQYQKGTLKNKYKINNLSQSYGKYGSNQSVNKINQSNDRNYSIFKKQANIQFQEYPIIDVSESNSYNDSQFASNASGVSPLIHLRNLNIQSLREEQEEEQSNNTDDKQKEDNQELSSSNIQKVSLSTYTGSKYENSIENNLYQANLGSLKEREQVSIQSVKPQELDKKIQQEQLNGLAHLQQFSIKKYIQQCDNTQREIDSNRQLLNVDSERNKSVNKEINIKNLNIRNLLQEIPEKYEQQHNEAEGKYKEQQLHSKENVEAGNNFLSNAIFSDNQLNESQTEKENILEEREVATDNKFINELISRGKTKHLYFSENQL